MLHFYLDEEKTKKLSDFSKQLFSYYAQGNKEGPYWVRVIETRGKTGKLMRGHNRKKTLVYNIVKMANVIWNK